MTPVTVGSAGLAPGRLVAEAAALTGIRGLRRVAIDGAEKLLEPGRGACGPAATPIPGDDDIAAGVPHVRHVGIRRAGSITRRVM